MSKAKSVTPCAPSAKPDGAVGTGQEDGLHDGLIIASSKSRNTIGIIIRYGGRDATAEMSPERAMSFADGIRAAVAALQSFGDEPPTQTGAQGETEK